MKTFDSINIGTGQAGPSLAARLSAAGKTVAIIERHKFGGTCVNTGCIPTRPVVFGSGWFILAMMFLGLSQQIR
jgi:pyruvate/2-oxoglutarate dehydrogenase complex dihydrolipoamide dehydrogenase (E3) component